MPEPKRVAIVISLAAAFKRHQEVFAGVSRYARKSGWSVDVLQYGSQIRTASRGDVAYDGIVGRVDRGLARFARARRIPLVNVWFSSPVTGVPLVAPDYARVGEMAAEHLRSRGFRRFAYLGYPERASRVVENGFGSALGGDSASSVMETPLDYTDSADAFVRFEKKLHAWLESLQLPVGVFVGDDELARMLINAATFMGISLPADMAVVGMFNEDVFCRIGEPTLTSIDVGFDKVGYRAARLLDDLMSGGQPDATEILLPPRELVPRDSSDVFASDDPLVAQALRYIADNCDRPISVADVVASLATCGRTLARHFKKERGCRVSDEILRMRIARAKRLLVDDTSQIKQIAKQCGFVGSTQFGMAFRRLERVSPQQYRSRR